MKMLFSTLFLITLTLSMTAQNASHVLNNMKYITKVVSNSKSEKIKKIQNMVADYNIENADGYNAKNKSTYDVMFQVSNCKIEATYNSSGEILKSTEVYVDMRLPMSLAKQIIKGNNQWSISNNLQKVYYNRNSSAYRIYEVEIKKDNEIQNLKFKIDSEDNNKAYVALN